ncbi:uncharacterized protein [Asterias amurensis]|uniref:uncharacterized protein n=1 Tax=Asterias amurensis TaxID=7602 RepID=UPI003AB20196
MITARKVGHILPWSDVSSLHSCHLEFLGLMNIYAMRVKLSIALVATVNTPLTNHSSVCPTANMSHTSNAAFMRSTGFPAPSSSSGVSDVENNPFFESVDRLFEEGELALQEVTDLLLKDVSVAQEEPATDQPSSLAQVQAICDVQPRFSSPPMASHQSRQSTSNILAAPANDGCPLTAQAHSLPVTSGQSNRQSTSNVLAAPADAGCPPTAQAHSPPVAFGQSNRQATSRSDPRPIVIFCQLHSEDPSK